MRKKFVAGNWKMNTNNAGAIRLAKEIAVGSANTAGEKLRAALCPPFVYLADVVKALSNAQIAVGAQNVYFENNGAYTGEISVSMLKDIGCTYVICGHSERRHIIGENDDLINKKVTAAINGGLLPILCVGELIEQRQAGKTQKVVTEQIEKALTGLNEEKMYAVTIAYEPVWAIGTGHTATPQQAQQVHSFIRELIAKIYSKELAEQLCIQYGGSVKPQNTAQLISQPDIDGALVGGASLKADDFVQIIKAAAET